MKYRAKILIVEDEKITALDLRNIVEKLGYEVCSIADSGKEALREIELQGPDLILMDIMLKGGMNGIETATIINSIRPIPIMYLTALNDDETFLNAKNASDYGYIIKPFSEIVIDETLEKTVLKSRMDNLQRFG